MVAAEFDRDRLRTLLPRLQERVQQAAAAEAHARWLAQYERVSAMVENSARRLASYPELVVSFHLVVHPVLAEEAGVARLQ